MVRNGGQQKRTEAYRPVNPQRICEVIRRQRMAAGMTQRQLAALLFVDQSLIARWESGQRIPGGPELVDLMALLEFTRADIV